MIHQILSWHSQKTSLDKWKKNKIYKKQTKKHS